MLIKETVGQFKAKEIADFTGTSMQTWYTAIRSDTQNTRVTTLAHLFRFLKSKGYTDSELVEIVLGE